MLAAAPRSLLFWSFFYFVAASVSAFVCWGFALDDAFIIARYATHLAHGQGYRFNPNGPVTDGVTPLPFAPLASLVAGSTVLETMMRLRILGCAAWVLAASCAGYIVARVCNDRSGRFLSLLLFLAMASPAAHASSGMETALTALTATLCVALSTSQGDAAKASVRQFAFLLPLAAVPTLRPEMAGWAATFAILMGETLGRGLVLALASLVPFACIAATRATVFGTPAPLSVFAKPGVLTQGLAYAVSATLVLALPLAVAAPKALASGQTPRFARAATAAFVVHTLVVVAVGGDWMPLSRLFVPALLPLLVAFAATFGVMNRRALAFRLVPALGIAILPWRTAIAARDTWRDRQHVLDSSRAVLATKRCVAALDIGWVGASTDAAIVDLAGLTDPAIAVLPGGHTSKRVDATMLRSRGVDGLVALFPCVPTAGTLLGPGGLPWSSVQSPCAAAREVERHLLRSMAGDLVLRQLVPLGQGAAWQQTYALFDVSPAGR